MGTKKTRVFLEILCYVMQEILNEFVIPHAVRKKRISALPLNAIHIKKENGLKNVLIHNVLSTLCAEYRKYFELFLRVKVTLFSDVYLYVKARGVFSNVILILNH